MSKAQVEQRLNQKFIKCVPFQEHLTCDTKPYLTIANRPFLVRSDFINEKLDAVMLESFKKLNCFFVVTPSGDWKLPPSPGSEESKKAEACLAPHKDSIESLYNETISALIAKYGQPSSTDKILQAPIWHKKRMSIMINRRADYDEAGMYIRYEKSSIYDAI